MLSIQSSFLKKKLKIAFKGIKKYEFFMCKFYNPSYGNAGEDGFIAYLSLRNCIFLRRKEDCCIQSEFHPDTTVQHKLKVVQHQSFSSSVGRSKEVVQLLDLPMWLHTRVKKKISASGMLYYPPLYYRLHFFIFFWVSSEFR